MVANLDGRTVDKLGIVHNAHAKAREIVFAGGVHVGHFSGFAAKQGTVGLTAAFGHAADDGLRRIHVKLARCKIIQEKQRIGTLYQDIVDAHGHQVCLLYTSPSPRD